MSIATINPATGETLKTFEPLDQGSLEQKIALAARTAEEYRHTTFARRAAWMRRAGEILEQEKDRWGRLMVTEMGKPIGAAVAEAEKCAWVCRYYADHAEDFLAPEQVETGAARSGIRYLPLGPVLAVMPWNFPFWQVFRFAAPGLMAGNVGLLKHASNVPQCALGIEEIFQRAGFPEGTFQTLLIGADRVAGLLADRRIRAATLTGSVPAGRSVAGEAGRQLKKTVLELGGSDPFIVMPSADLDAAIQTAVRARIINNGQSCIAAKRFIVHERIADEFERRFAAGMEGLVVGDPMDPSTEVGPLAMEQTLRDVADQVERSVKAGAGVRCGGRRLERKGYYYAPTVLTGIPAEAPAAREEIFGPVASIFRVPDLDQAIALANDSDFGLGSSAWTSDEQEQERLLRELDAGMTFINAMVASDPRLPFGGVKDSGYGRELGGFGIREFVNIKSVWIA